MMNLKTTLLTNTSLKSTGVGNKGNEVKEMTLQIIASMILTAAVVFMIIATIETIRKHFFLSSIYNTIGSFLVVAAIILNHFIK